MLEPNTVPTDYLVPGGMTIDQLRACAELLAKNEVVGIEIGELRGTRGFINAEPSRTITSTFEPLLQVALGSN